MSTFFDSFDLAASSDYTEEPENYWGDLLSSSNWQSEEHSPLILDTPAADDLIPSTSRDSFQNLLLRFSNTELECLVAFLEKTHSRCDDSSALSTLCSFFRSGESSQRLHEASKGHGLTTSSLFSACPSLLWNPFIAPALLTLLDISTPDEYKNLSTQLPTLSQEDQTSLLDLLEHRENWYVLRQDLLPKTIASWKPKKQLPPSPATTATLPHEDFDPSPFLLFDEYEEDEHTPKLVIEEFPVSSLILNIPFSKHDRCPTLLVEGPEFASDEPYFVHCSLVMEKSGEVIPNALEGMGPFLPITAGIPLRLDSLKLKATSRLAGAKRRFRLLFELTKGSGLGSEVVCSVKSECFTVTTRRQQLKKDKIEMEDRRARVLHHIRNPQQIIAL